MVFIRLLIVAILLSALGGLGYAYYLLQQEYTTTKQDFTHAVEQYENGIHDLNEKIAAVESLNNDLQTLLRAKQEENSAYSTQVQELAHTVKELDKLSKTDRELLQKYSSVFFLNENFVPQPLVPINPTFALKPEKELHIHGNVQPFLERLLVDSNQNGIDLKILSAYRSFGEQATLKSTYKINYGAGTANSFSAEQGYSEHQLGSTVDFTTVKIGDTLSGFDKTASFTWLNDNAYKYGFALSYPKGNKYFVFEPWHWRFVGVELATKLHEEHKYFYDLDQRDINQYLVKMFD